MSTVVTGTPSSEHKCLDAASSDATPPPHLWCFPSFMTASQPIRPGTASLEGKFLLRTASTKLYIDTRKHAMVNSGTRPLQVPSRYTRLLTASFGQEVLVPTARNLFRNCLAANAISDCIGSHFYPCVQEHIVQGGIKLGP